MRKLDEGSGSSRSFKAEWMYRCIYARDNCQRVTRGVFTSPYLETKLTIGLMHVIQPVACELANFDISVSYFRPMRSTTGNFDRRSTQIPSFLSFTSEPSFLFMSWSGRVLRTRSTYGNWVTAKSKRENTTTQSETRKFKLSQLQLTYMIWIISNSRMV